jgi:DNA polymerase-3 subunit epsilon
MYAVLNIETTALNPDQSHRVCDIAIILVDRHGRIEREWCSRVNPERDPGGQRIVAADDTPGTPSFDRLAGEVAELLAERLIVAHNPPFDTMLLRREYNLLGVDVPLRPELCLSAMALAAQYIPLTGRSSRGFSLAVDVKADVEHSALADARTAASLLTSYLSVAPDPVPWAALLEEVAGLRWPSPPVEAATRTGMPPRAPRVVPRVPEPE